MSIFLNSVNVPHSPDSPSSNMFSCSSPVAYNTLSGSSSVVFNMFSCSSSKSAVSVMLSSAISFAIVSVEFKSLAATAESEHKRENKIKKIAIALFLLIVYASFKF